MTNSSLTDRFSIRTNGTIWFTFWAILWSGKLELSGIFHFVNQNTVTTKMAKKKSNTYLSHCVRA